MTLNAAMEAIESYGFAAEVNLASGSLLFHDALRKHHLVSELLENLKLHGATETLLKRISHLSARQIHLDFENPHDVALAAYLTALELYDLDSASLGAEAVGHARNCWWAAEVSRRILQRPKAIREAPHLATVGTGRAVTFMQPFAAIANKPIGTLGRGSALSEGLKDFVGRDSLLGATQSHRGVGRSEASTSGSTGSALKRKPVKAQGGANLRQGVLTR